MGCNGWKNYATWNVWAWLGNDRELYGSMMRYIEQYGTNVTYHGLLTYLHYPKDTSTPDKVKWWDPEIDAPALDEAIRELAEDYEKFR